MADVVYIDQEEGIRRLMNNGKLYAKILAKFKADTDLGGLEAAIGAQSWDSAKAVAHAIKGVAANLSLIELFKQIEGLETQIEGQSVAPDAVEKLRSCFAETMIHVNKVIAKYA